MKRTIRLTESDLRQVIKESVTRILKETNSDDALNLYKQRFSQADNAIFTPNYGNLKDKAYNTQKYYNKRFGAEHSDMSNVQAYPHYLSWNDTLPDGTPVSYGVEQSGVYIEMNGNGQSCSITDLKRNIPYYRKLFCRMSPKAAEMVAKWYKQNSLNPEKDQFLMDPSFWTEYSNQ